MHCPTSQHWIFVKNVCFIISMALFITVYSVSACVACILLTPNYNSITQISHRQYPIYHSSMKVEGRVVSTAVCDLLQIKSHTEFSEPTSPTPTIFCDYVITNYVCSNPGFHYVHFVYDKIQYGDIHVSYVVSSDQLVDALAKPLYITQFHLIRSKIGL